jgi:hypothetical protein
MAGNNFTERSRNILIDREFQLRLALRISGAMVLLLLPYALVALVAPTFFGLSSGQEDSEQEAQWQVADLIKMAILPISVTFIFLFVHAVREGFRIAGSSYRFRKVFESLRDLRVPYGVRIRKNDYLQETADSLDGALKSLHLQVRELQRAGSKLREQMGAVTPAEDCAEAWAQVQENMSELSSRLDLFDCEESPAVKPLASVQISSATASADLAEVTAD